MSAKVNTGNAQFGGNDLNTFVSRNGDLEGITEVDRDGPAGDQLDQEEDSNSAVVSGPETEHVMMPEGDDAPRSPYGVLTLNDVLPIETARARFLQIIIDHFIIDHTVVTPEPHPDMNDNSLNQDVAYEEARTELKADPDRQDIAHEGDPRYLLPMTFIANLYETLILEVNQRLVTVEGVHEKKMGVALEAAEGIYRRLNKKYPKSCEALNVTMKARSPTTFKSTEVTSALEAGTKFPQLVSGNEKRVHIVVVHGLKLVERPALLPLDDAGGFKRLTGRHEAVISPRDYNFFSSRVKHRRPRQHSEL